MDRSVVGSVICKPTQAYSGYNFIVFFSGVCVVFLLLAAGNMSSLVKLHVHGDLGKTGDLRIWLVICFAVLLPCSWLGTPKEFWGIAVGASLATAVACLMICVCIGLDMPADLKNVQQPTVNFESFFSGMENAARDFSFIMNYATTRRDSQLSLRQTTWRHTSGVCLRALSC